MELTSNTTLNDIQQDLEEKFNNNIIDKNDFELIKKMISKADTIEEAFEIYQLGLIKSKTGLVFEPKFESYTDTIKYLKKNEAMSFTNPKGGEHTLISGDNFYALLNLMVSYRNTIDVIYIDPPYGKDALNNGADGLSYADRNRDDLLSDLRPRLMLAKNLLNDRGSIFVSIDDRNMAYVRCLMDEVFGEINFVGTLLRRTVTNPNEKIFSKNYDYVIIYRKSMEIYLEDSGTKTNNQKYTRVDDNLEKYGRYLIKQTIDKPKYYSRNLDFAYEINGKTFVPGGDMEAFKARQKLDPIDIPRSEFRWTWNKETIDWGFENGLLEISGNRIYKKQYENVSVDAAKKEIKPKTDEPIYMDGFTFADNSFVNEKGTKGLSKLFDNKVPFSFAKPVDLVKGILSFCPDDAIVLDFYAGSGTTGEAVLQKNKEDGGTRQFILVNWNKKTKDQPNGIVNDVTFPRLNKVMNNEGLGGSLTTYEIESIKDNDPKLFELIDEKNYLGKSFSSKKEKIEWVCENFLLNTKELN